MNELERQYKNARLTQLISRYVGLAAGLSAVALPFVVYQITPSNVADGLDRVGAVLMSALFSLGLATLGIIGMSLGIGFGIKARNMARFIAQQNQPQAPASDHGTTA